MLSVQLLNLTFHAFHGVYEGEGLVGNNYQVDLTVMYDEKNVQMHNPASVINYEKLFEIVKKRMAIPSPLLEEVAETVILKIRHQYPIARQISLSIFKLQPPIEGFQGKIGVTLLKTFED
ncbi:MAG: dihydroneopterin aldolase [Chitinophagaceae bacterium]